MVVRNLESDPLRNFKFSVTIDLNIGSVYGHLSKLNFMSVSGLAVSTEPISYREGGDNTTVRKMPGQTSFPEVSLTRGVVGSAADRSKLWQWYKKIFFVVQGGAGTGSTGAEGVASDFRAEVYIRAYDHPVTAKGQPNGGRGIVKAAWKLYNAWPAALAFSDLDAGGNGVVVNNLTLMHEGFDFAVAAHPTDNRLDGLNWDLPGE